MAGITLSEAGNAIVYRSVPWAHTIFSLKSQSFPKGAVPAHLMGYLFTTEPRSCAAETAKLSGSARVRAMNSCISKLRKGRR